VFFEYPLRPEVFALHALSEPEVAARVGLQPTTDGTWPGVVAFRDIDGSARVGITCALCHVSIEDGTLVEGRARRDLDYGEMRLAYHRDYDVPLPDELARRMAEWGRGRADITQDEDEDPVAIVDLWGVRSREFLTQAATLRHVHPAALAIRQETQILHANRERTRPPRALAWALAMYVYSLTPPSRDVVANASPRAAQGASVFDAHCRSCHSDPSGSGAPIAASTVGTDPTLAFGSARGTGLYRPSPLTAVVDAAPYLHQGVVPDLVALLDPARLEPTYAHGLHGPGPIAGHRYGMDLSPTQRSALIDFLGTL
jgi:cytochrome c5